MCKSSVFNKCLTIFVPILESWDNILTPLARLREPPGLLNLFPRHLKGEMLSGLSEPSILKMIESVRMT